MELLVRKHAHLDLLARSARQNAGASDVLVALGRVHIQLKNQLEGLRELALLRNALQVWEHIMHAELFGLEVEHRLHLGLSGAPLLVPLLLHLDRGALLHLERLQNILLIKRLVPLDFLLAKFAHPSVNPCVSGNFPHLEVEHRTLP